jgi:hypothetical protein
LFNAELVDGGGVGLAKGEEGHRRLFESRIVPSYGQSLTQAACGNGQIHTKDYFSKIVGAIDAFDCAAGEAAGKWALREIAA